jgi:hypothetical protein
MRVAVLFEKRALQVCVALSGLVPVMAGASGVIQDLAGADAAPVSHARYLSGLLLAIGLASWTTIPDIGLKAERFRLLTALVMIGGFCRLLGVAMGDVPSWPVMGALGMELFVTPLLCLWQSSLRTVPLAGSRRHLTRGLAPRSC